MKPECARTVGTSAPSIARGVHVAWSPEWGKSAKAQGRAAEDPKVLAEAVAAIAKLSRTRVPFRRPRSPSTASLARRRRVRSSSSPHTGSKSPASSFVCRQKQLTSQLATSSVLPLRSIDNYVQDWPRNGVADPHADDVRRGGTQARGKAARRDPRGAQRAWDQRDLPAPARRRADALRDRGHARAAPRQVRGRRRASARERARDRGELREARRPPTLCRTPPRPAGGPIVTASRRGARLPRRAPARPASMCPRRRTAVSDASSSADAHRGWRRRRRPYAHAKARSPLFQAASAVAIGEVIPKFAMANGAAAHPKM